MGLGRNAGKEIFEAGGAAVADRSGFAAFTAAWMYDRMGEKAAFGAIKGIEVVLTTVAESLGGNYADMAVDGFFDGIGDEINLELKAIKRMDEGARKKHIAKILKKDGGADTHDAHGADTHGTKHEAGRTHGPASVPAIDLFDAMATLQPAAKEQAQTVIGFLDERYPDMLGAVVYLQSRPGFTRRFLARVTGLTDAALILMSTRELISQEAKKIRDEEAHKPKPLMARLRDHAHRLDGGVHAILDELGVPALEADHGHGDPHGTPALHGHHAPYRGMPHGTVTHNPPHPTGPRFGTDWNALQDRLKGGSGH